jgi:glycosyltransferase involved in cell wall biosynthesis
MDYCKSDDEIIVMDGGSRDGTSEYLQQHYQSGKIHHFFSEKDFGESHGFNKAILMAKGVLIKVITDDDVFYYPGINDCKQYMLNNPAVHVMNSNGGWTDMRSLGDVYEFTEIYEKFFVEKWLSEKHPFAHCGLGLMFRRDAISLLGLIGVGFYRADAEYTLKITAQKKVNFVWYTGINYVRVLNEDSNSLVYKEKIQAETQRLNAFYGFDIDKIYFPEVKKEGLAYLAHWILRIPKGIIRRMMAGRQIAQQNSGTVSLNFAETFNSSVSWLASINQRQHNFLGE